MDGVGAPERGTAAFGETEIFDFSLGFELGHGFHCLLDGGFAVEAVGVVEVDVVDAETGEGFFAGFEAVLRGRVNTAVSLVVDGVGELGGQEDVVALAGVLLEPFSCVCCE